MTDTSIGLDHLSLRAGTSTEVVAGPAAESKASRDDAHAAVAASVGAAAGTLVGPEIGLALHDLEAIAALWRAFEHAAHHTFFQTFAWLEAWHRHVGALSGTKPAIVTGTHPDGKLLFVLPLAIQNRGLVRELKFLGSDLCDYNAPLLDPEFSTFFRGDFTALWSRITTMLRADPRYAFDVIDLAKMPDHVGSQPNPLMALRTEANPSGAYVTRLSGTWDEFYAAKRSSSTRKKERQQLRQLGEFGEIRFVDTLEGDERRRTLDILFEQKARSFARMGVRNIFTRPGYRELFTAFAMDPTTRPLVHLSRLEVGSTVAAVSVGFTEGNCYYLVISSYDGGEMARVGPGRVHLHELLRFALRNSFDKFDFTIGDEAYKRDWSDDRLTLYDHTSAVTPSGAIAVALTNWFRTAKRAIKQNPTLWREFSRARSALGSMRARRLAKSAESTERDSDA
jgi:CelD/BcsL family acetyltransferase involved in cellulose biosynthesis